VGLIEKRGAYYSYGDLRLGQGRDSAKEFLRQNADIAQEIENGIREKKGLLPFKARSSEGEQARTDELVTEPEESFEA